MNNNTQSSNGERKIALLHKINNFLASPIGGFVGAILGGTLTSCLVLLIEYKSGLFQSSQENSIYSVSPLWLFISTFTVVALLISFFEFIRISINSQKYFREEFTFVALSVIFWLISAFAVSLQGSLMFWYPFVAGFYVLSGQKVAISRPSWEGFALLFVLILLFYMVAVIRHQNWDGLISTQQHQREQRSESSGIILECIGELRRLLKREGTLERYSELDSTQLLGQLEQSEDFISQAWEEQARELLRLSSSSYAIDLDSGWHDKQGCWVGRNIDTRNLVLLYPVHTTLSKSDLDTFLHYSEGIAQAENQQIGELIVAFREENYKLATPTDSYRDIRFETEQNLLEKLVNFTDYYNDIRKRVLIQKLPESDLTLHDVYVPSQLLISKKEGEDSNVEIYLRKWIDEPSQRQIALLGEYGQGKSSAALMFTHRLICERDQTLERIPILIELRGKSPRDLRPLELLGAWASQYRIEPQALMRLHIAGRLVIIFEGFDEMALIGNAESRLRHFTSLWKFCYPNAKIIITGRPNFFLDDREMKRALGIITPISDRPYCEAIRLAPFTIDQIQEALRVQKPLVRDQICSLAQSEDRFLEIVSRPSLLHVVSVLWERERLHEKTGLLSSAYVMECFVKSSYRRQGLKAQGSRDFMALNSSERDYFMCGIASYMAAVQLSNQISNEQLNNLICNLTDSIPISVSTSPSEILGEDTRPLQSRIQDPKNDMEHVITDVRTCGLLVDDSSTSGTFKFGHKSFMEYLFAVTVKEYIWDASSEKARAIKKVTYFPIETILDLPVSIGFLAEMIGTDAATKKLDSYSYFGPRGEHSTSIRLLKVIFNSRNFISWLILRFLLFGLSYFASIKEQKSIQTKIFLHTNSLIFAMICALSFMTILSVLSISSVAYTSLRGYFLFMAMMTGAAAVMFDFAIILTRSESLVAQSITRKFRLWNSICKELHVGDEVLHKIAGTDLLPWIRNQPFNYFLKKPKMKDDNA